jgi:hypothetical protein
MGQNRERMMERKKRNDADSILVFQPLSLMTSKFFAETFLRACAPELARSVPYRSDVTASRGVEE